MAATNNEQPPPASSSSLHPAVTVSNIRNYIPIILDAENGQYTSWVELFQVHCRAFDVIDHIIQPEPKDTTSSSTPNPLWSRLDAIVLQWIYGTISNDLLHTSHMHAPRTSHFNALKRILRYVKGTITMGIHMHPSPISTLVSYTDADWAGCPDTRRSTSGYCVFLGDNLLSWSSKRQSTISRSSAEAEYRGVANAVAEICWLRNLLLELGFPPTRTSLVYCDNVSAAYLSSNPVNHQRTKHIEIDIHFVREKVQRGQVRVLHVPSPYNFSDVFTKGLSRALFNDFRSSLSIREPPP